MDCTNLRSLGEPSPPLPGHIGQIEQQTSLDITFANREGMPVQRVAGSPLAGDGERERRRSWLRERERERDLALAAGAAAGEGERRRSRLGERRRSRLEERRRSRRGAGEWRRS